MCTEADLLDSFISGGVYLFKNDRNVIFVCIPCSQVEIGKLVQYRKQTSTMFEKTNIAYFLNFFFENDIKSVFLNRENYDLIGRIGNNFEFSKDRGKKYLLRINKNEQSTNNK